MFGSAPVLVLPRTVMIRVLLFLIVLPLALLCAWGTIAALRGPHPDNVGAGMLGFLAVGFGGAFAFFYGREKGRVTRLFAEGIDQTIGSRTRELRWSEVTEVWFQAIKVQAGGVVGLAVGAVVDAATKRKNAPLDARSTNITVRLVGRSGEKIALTSNDKGVVAAFEEILRRVNPRLLEESLQRIQGGDAVSFGNVSISLRGIASGRKEPTAFHEIETFGIQNGKLTLKKKGSWLTSLSAPIQKIPNVFVLTELHARLTTNPEQTSSAPPGKNLAQRMYV